jgi:hypothetical protein
VSRIRSLKPSFFMSESVGAVSFAARLLFAGLWTLADREGRLVWKPRTIKAQIFPHDDGLEIAPLAEEIVAADLMRFYQDAHHTYAWLPGFTKHQRPHPKEPLSDIPAYADVGNPGWLPWKETAGREKPGCIPSAPVGREGKGMEWKGTVPAATATAAPSGHVPVARPIFSGRNLRAAFEHPRFDVPGWWHLEKVKGLPGGESEMLKFYQHLSQHIEAHPDERTEPRKPWLNDHFTAWLSKTAAPSSSSGIPSPAETLARINARKAMVGL